MEKVSSSNSQGVRVPKLRFPGFEGEWEEKNMGEIFNEIVEKNRPELPVLSILQGEGTVLRDNSDRRISYDKASLNSYKVMNEGDFIIHLRSFEGGLECSKHHGISSPAYKVLRTTCLIPEAYKDYFRSYKFIHGKLSIAVTGIRDGKSIDMPSFWTIKIALPDICEQNKIASFLSLLNNRIEKQRQLVEAFKSYKRGVFLHLYKLIDKQKVFFQEIYVKASEGGTPSTSNAAYYVNGTIPFAKIEDLSQHYLTKTKSFITEQGLKNSSAWIIPSESIIFSNGATIGACSINRIPIATKQGVLGLVLKKEYSSNFMYHFFTSSIFKRKIRAITTKGTMDCAYLKDIDKIGIEIPSFVNQVEIANILDSLELIVECQKQVLDALTSVKNSLLQQLFI